MLKLTNGRMNTNEMKKKLYTPTNFIMRNTFIIPSLPVNAEFSYQQSCVQVH